MIIWPKIKRKRKKKRKWGKRNSYIGVKVQQKTRDQLNYIAKREANPISTLIDKILKEYIETYFKIAKIDWETLPNSEKRGEDK